MLLTVLLIQKQTTHETLLHSAGLAINETHWGLRQDAHRRSTVYQSLLTKLKKDLVPSQSQCSNKYTFIHDTEG